MNRKTKIITIALILMMGMTAQASESERGGHDHIYDKLKAESDIIFASPGAEGDILDLLRKDREVFTFEDEVMQPFILGPMVVVAADLENPAITWLLNEVFEAGRTVAVIDATQDEADRFHRFFGAANQANCEPAEGDQTIDLYGIQASTSRRPELISSYCLVGARNLKKQGYHSWRSPNDVRRWLQERFVQTAPEPSIADVTDDSQNIVDLATATHCSYYSAKDPENQGRQIQVDTYVTSARSFVNEEDIYYVENKLQYQQGTSGNTNSAFAVLRVGATGIPQFTNGVTQSQPAAVKSFVSATTNTTTDTISGSVGFDAKGPSATVGGSVSFGKSKTTSVPPIIISNNTEISPPLPQWTFQRQSVSNNENFGPETSWFWTVPKASYSDSGEGLDGALSFRYLLSMGGTFNEPTESGDFVVENSCNIPYPFNGLWDDSVGNPTITSLNPSSVAVGDKFTITGTELYPGLVTNVFIGGNAIDFANVTPKGETSRGSGVFTVEVLVPSEASGEATVVIQTEFNGEKTSSPAMEITITDSED